jgi:hypothetical protein
MPAKQKLQIAIVLFTAAISGLMAGPVPALAQEDSHISGSRGQTVYVPAYSHIYGGDRERPVYLAVTLSIRNTDPEQSITITRADYYDSEGRLIKEKIKDPVTLSPLHSTRFVIKESHKSGGSGAKFLVEWEANSPASPPIIESIMISTRGQQGISFTTRGRVIREKK